MSEPFIGELKLVGFNFAPRGYAICNGALLSIAQNSALFSLLGTTYGGNGTTTFGLPDLRGRAPLGQTVPPAPGLGTYTMGQTAGTENTTLIINNMPIHNHLFAVPATSNDATLKNPVGNIPAATQNAIYAPPGGGQGGAQSATGVAGGSQPFSILQPYQVANWVIALEGIFPSRN